MPSQNSNDDFLAADLLRGGDQIAAYLGWDVREVYHGLATGSIPARKIKGFWIGSKRVLTEFFTTPNNTPAPPDPNIEPTDSSEAEAPPPREVRAARSGRPSVPRRSARSARR